MMNPNSSGSGAGSAGSGKGQPPPPLTMNLPSSQSPPFAPTLQQQQNLAMQWLEQQQRNSFNPAAFLSAAGPQLDQSQQQQPPPQQQSLLRHNVSHSISPLASQSSNSSDLRHQQQLLEIEIRRQILLQQQQQQQQQQLATQARDNLNFEQLKALLQGRLGSSIRPTFTGIPTNGSQGGTSVVPPASVSGSSLATSEVNHMMSAETLLQRSMLHDAIRTLQLQGGLLQQNNSSRIANSNLDSTSFASSAFLLPNEAITPHNIGQASLTNTATSQLLQPGILDMGPVVPKAPRIDDENQSINSRTKRKSDCTSGKEEPLPKKLKPHDGNIENRSSFPLPSTKQTRRLKLSFESFQDVWDELETTPLQKDIFIRRLNKYDCHLVD